jgi:tRNA (cytidine/uridine-2'-O-)-methyltransferase
MEVALLRPQIPQNTGSIARTCAGTRSKLHVIGPTPFKINEKNVKRAGLDYWHLVDLEEHLSWQSFLDKNRQRRIIGIETTGDKYHFDFRFQKDDILLFGGEVTGLDDESQSVCFDIVKIPIEPNTVRSLNLSNCVSIVLYEAIRQVLRTT